MCWDLHGIIPAFGRFFHKQLTVEKLVYTYLCVRVQYPRAELEEVGTEIKLAGEALA